MSKMCRYISEAVHLNGAYISVLEVESHKPT